MIKQVYLGSDKNGAREKSCANRDGNHVPMRLFLMKAPRSGAKLEKDNNMSQITMTAIATGLILAIMPVTASAKDGGGQRPSFEQIDANADGAITPDEVSKMQLVRFASADGNGDGLFTAEELAAQMGKRGAERVERMIERQDANGDGVLSAEELLSRGDRAARFFERLDTNEDGSISQSEFDDAPKRGPRRSGSRGNKANN